MATQTGFFWMNGKQLQISTKSLFTFVRFLPEPIPLEMVRWSSMTSSLAASDSQWSTLLAAELYKLIAAIYEHHEIILAQLDPLNQSNAMRSFEQHLTSLWEIVGVAAGAPPLSAWATEEEDVHDAETQFALNHEPLFLAVIDLPHIRRLIGEAERPELKSRALRLQAEYNKFKKHVRRRQT